MRNFIAANPDWLARLVNEYAIIVNTDGDLVSLKYNQLESPMHDPLVAQCRGMVVHAPSGRILAHPYDKFWNHGDALAPAIDWESACVQEKLDGSLMILYFDPFEDGWRVASSGTPRASGRYGDTGMTYREAFWYQWTALGMLKPVAPVMRSVTFMFEFCGAPNRVVVRYPKPRIVLHGARHADGRELPRGSLRILAKEYDWELVAEHPIGCIADCLAAADKLHPADNEGYVVVDGNFNRIKVKSPAYVALHHLKGNGPITTRRVIELWQTGELAELLTHFPEVEGDIAADLLVLQAIAISAAGDFAQHRGAPTRKEFAVAVKDACWAPVTFALFKALGPDGGNWDDLERDAQQIMRNMTTQAVERLVEDFRPWGRP